MPRHAFAKLYLIFKCQAYISEKRLYGKQLAEE